MPDTIERFLEVEDIMIELVLYLVNESKPVTLRRRWGTPTYAADASDVPSAFSPVASIEYLFRGTPL